MANSCTPEDLIRLIYHETSTEEESRLKRQLAADPDFLSQYYQLLESTALLDELKMEPSETSVNLILEYSREQIEETSHA
jgi:hypothetical protein